MRTITRTAIVTLIVILLALVATPASAQTGVSDRYGCGDLADYQTALFTAIPLDDVETLLAILNKDFERVRPSEFAEASRIMDDWAAELEAMPLRDVPMAARAYHAAFIDFLSVSSSVMSAMATGNMFGALAYSDAIDQSSLDLNAANRAGARMCGARWSFDATPEALDLAA